MKTTILTPLDSDGAELMQSMLRTSTIDNIFLISHKSDTLRDKVDSIIEFELKNNFTQIKEE